MLKWKEYDDSTIKEFERQALETGKLIESVLAKYKALHDLPVFDPPEPEMLDKINAIEITKDGRPSYDVANELLECVFNKSMMIQHPRFFSFVPSALSPYSLAGSIMADMFNLHGGGYAEAPGACLIEEKLIAWMASLAGYPADTAGGVFLSGGSMANMSAMVAARDDKLKPSEFATGVIYVSDQTHSSVKKGLRIIGFQPNQIIIVPSDDEYKMRIDLLEEEIEKDLRAGRIPFAVVGTIGTTNTGSIDPLCEIAEIAKKYNLWFHIDGAFGGSILISEIYSNLAKGVELSDSLSWDTHKWLGQVYSCSTLIVRDKSKLLDSFSEHPEYLADVKSADHNDAWDLGPEMTRPHRAIKLWYTIQASGTDLLSDAIDYAFFNSNTVKKELEKYGNWEILSQPCCGTINFRYHPEGYREKELDALNHMISYEIIATQYAHIVTTVLKGKTCLRMCTINAYTQTDEIIETMRLLNEIATNLVEGK